MHGMNENGGGGGGVPVKMMEPPFAKAGATTMFPVMAKGIEHDSSVCCTNIFELYEKLSRTAKYSQLMYTKSAWVELKN